MVIQAISTIGGFASLPFVAAGAAKSWLDFRDLIPGKQPLPVAKYIARLGSPLWVEGAHAFMGAAAILQSAEAAYHMWQESSQDPIVDGITCASGIFLAATLLAVNLAPQRLVLHSLMGAAGMMVDLGATLYHGVSSGEFTGALVWNGLAMGLLFSDLRHIQALYRAWHARSANYAFTVTITLKDKVFAETKYLQWLVDRHTRHVVERGWAVGCGIVRNDACDDGVQYIVHYLFSSKRRFLWYQEKMSHAIRDDGLQFLATHGQKEGTTFSRSFGPIAARFGA